MAIVIDASFVAAWLLPGAASDETDAIGQRLLLEPGLAPSHFWHEIRNLLLSAHRHGRLSRENLMFQVAKLDNIPIADCGPCGASETLRLALAHDLSAYDAAYLSLALAERAPLATLSRALARAAKAEGVGLVGPLGF